MELVVFVGLPGSGKTTYYSRHFAHTHVHISKDVMKSVRQKNVRQRQQIEHALRQGKSVVIDNTNATPEIRASLVELAHHHGARVIAYYFDTPVADAVARNRQREEGRGKVPDVAIYVTRAKLKPPTPEEGFDEVHVVKPETTTGAGGPR
jgi:predicted kinase